MQSKKEKMVMYYLCQMCPKKKTYLISPRSISEYVSKKYILSVAEIDEIMVSLESSNYIDFVVSDSKNGYYYCINLKKKGQSFIEDQKRERRKIISLILRTVALSLLSFATGLILKAIFKG